MRRPADVSPGCQRLPDPESASTWAVPEGPGRRTGRRRSGISQLKQRAVELLVGRAGGRIRRGRGLSEESEQLVLPLSPRRHSHCARSRRAAGASSASLPPPDLAASAARFSTRSRPLSLPASSPAPCRAPPPVPGSISVGAHGSRCFQVKSVLVRRRDSGWYALSPLGTALATRR